LRLALEESNQTSSTYVFLHNPTTAIDSCCVDQVTIDVLSDDALRLLILDDDDDDDWGHSDVMPNI
jgi:hypothetical protein